MNRMSATHSVPMFNVVAAIVSPAGSIMAITMVSSIFMLFQVSDHGIYKPFPPPPPPPPPTPPPSSASDEITVSGQLVPMFTRNLETAQAYAVIGYGSAFRYPVCSFILCLYDLRNVECTNAACPQVPHVCIFVTKMY